MRYRYDDETDATHIVLCYTITTLSNYRFTRAHSAKMSTNGLRFDEIKLTTEFVDITQTTVMTDYCVILF